MARMIVIVNSILLGYHLHYLLFAEASIFKGIVVIAAMALSCSTIILYSLSVHDRHVKKITHVAVWRMPSRFITYGPVR